MITNWFLFSRQQLSICKQSTSGMWSMRRKVLKRILIVKLESCPHCCTSIKARTSLPWLMTPKTKTKKKTEPATFQYSRENDIFQNVTPSVIHTGLISIYAFIFVLVIITLHREYQKEYWYNKWTNDDKPVKWVFSLQALAYVLAWLSRAGSRSLLWSIPSIIMHIQFLLVTVSLAFPLW